MKRRTFILLASGGVVGAAIPIIHQWEELSDWKNPYAQPQMLSLITTRRNIKSLGKIYVEAFPDESNYNVLFNLLCGAKSGRAVSHETDDNVIRSMVSNRIKDDFHNKRVLVLNGWVLSVTEARQCALFFLLQM